MNLDFESANLPITPAPASPTLVSFSDAFPGWTGYAGTNQATQAFYNGVSLATAYLNLITPTTGSMALSNAVIDGNYTAVLRTGEDPANLHTGSIVSAAIAQTGLVPLGTQSLIFYLGSFSSSDGLSVTFNGQTLALVPLFAGSNFEAYGADVAALAGTIGELRFTESPASNPFNSGYIDDIQFSSAPVPEPSVLVLAALGSMLLGFRRRRRCSK